MKQGLKIITLSALATAAVITGAPALTEASLAHATNVSVVRTADLDLATEQGRRVLDHRLARAAADVCGDPSAADLKGANEIRRCRSDVLSDARARSGRLIAAREHGQGLFVAAR